MGGVIIKTAPSFCSRPILCPNVRRVGMVQRVGCTRDQNLGHHRAAAAQIQLWPVRIVRCLAARGIAREIFRTISFPFTLLLLRPDLFYVLYTLRCLSARHGCAFCVPVSRMKLIELCSGLWVDSAGAKCTWFFYNEPWQWKTVVSGQ